MFGYAFMFVYLSGCLLFIYEASCSSMSVCVCLCLHKPLFLHVSMFVAVIFDGSKVRAKARRGGGVEMCVALVEVSAAAFIDSVNAPAAPGAPGGSQRQTA